MPCAVDKSFVDDLVASGYCKCESKPCLTIHWGFSRVPTICSLLLFNYNFSGRIASSYVDFVGASPSLNRNPIGVSPLLLRRSASGSSVGILIGKFWKGRVSRRYAAREFGKTAKRRTKFGKRRSAGRNLENGEAPDEIWKTAKRRTEFLFKTAKRRTEFLFEGLY